MLATRGAVYKSKTTAKTARGKSSYHRHCKCSAELETRFDRRTDIRTDPADAARTVSNRVKDREYRYDLSKYRNLGVTEAPQPSRPASATRGNQPAVAAGRPVAEIGGAGGGQPPSRPLLTPAGPDEPAVFAAMDAQFESWARDLTEAQRTALNEWQKTDRFYEKIQAFLRGLSGQAPDGLDDVLEAIASGRITPEVALFRGLRNWSKLFPSLMPGTVVVDDGLLAATVARQVAVEEFAVGTRPLLMRLHPSGPSPGAWVAGAGDPRLRYQGELLMPPGAKLSIVGQDEYAGDVPVVDVEVWW